VAGGDDRAVLVVPAVEDLVNRCEACGRDMGGEERVCIYCGHWHE